MTAIGFIKIVLFMFYFCTFLGDSKYLTALTAMTSSARKMTWKGI